MSEENTEKVSGPCGIVGEASTSLKIKTLHRESKSTLSLKQFCQLLLREGGEKAELVKEWKDHKKGYLNKSRSEANAMIARAAGVASKAARKSKKDHGKKSAPAEEKPAKALVK